ncbi:nitrate- and nitrite sensing domain-containing protein [Kitasatospora sp. CMC57]|uniref:histidine kinase n=1 Tax=Kitasatospora sp. CMC57 TaxID=3231513 RepID=A0AB33JU59_9ACTN
MRLRSSSIRAKMIALLMVPIVALTGLWVYATLVTTGDVWSQLDVSAAYRTFGAPVDQYARDVQSERRAAVVRLADPDDKDAQEKYQQSRTVTDRSLQLLRYQADSSDAGKLGEVQRLRLKDVLAAADGIPAIRAEVDQRAKTWDKVIDHYADLVQPVFAFRTAFVSGQSGQLPRQGMVLTELVRAREYLSQEDAAFRGLRLSTEVAGRPGSRSPKPGSAMYQTALDALHSQQTLFKVYVAELDDQDQADYRAIRNSDSMATVAWIEAQFDTFQNPADRETELLRVPLASWNNGADKALDELSTLNTRLAGQIGALAKSYAVNQLVRGGIAGLVGLIAVVASVMISFRIGRGLARELIGLRNAALDLSGTRLPAVMLRLRRGEPVDIAAESPELDFGPAEIGEVGRAFNQVQRVAVEAAVEQAELRRGVSAVFVNLARRSQVLLHRQLTLLDTMERRTEDPAELEDLFKLDHLTTRMRRHAEGLIILSGGSPGRAWRKPVRMVDVVRAAVGEVEDYARVIVRPFPGTGLLGSAVADVTHLIAELVENAAVYSPPQAQVTVQGEVVAHGFSLEIDDRGLGLSEQALADINQRLAVEQEFDLADTDRLGLFVVSRLARRHGIRVHLRPSPYGGTAAIVLIPRELLAEAPDLLADAPAPPRATVVPPTGRPDLVSVPALGKGGGDSKGSGDGKGTGLGKGSADGGRGGHRRGESAPVDADEPARAPVRPAGGPRPSAAEPARTPGGLPRRRSSATGPTLVPAGSTGTGRHRRADSPAEQGPVPAPITAPAGGLLPRRVRQANLAPQLKNAGASDPGSEQSSRDRSPEEARSAFSSFQRGFQRGRGDRIQPASLTVVPDQPEPDAPPAPVRPAPRRPAALLPAPRPQALSAGPARSGTPVHPVTPAQPAPTEGTES